MSGAGFLVAAACLSLGLALGLLVPAVWEAVEERRNRRRVPIARRSAP